MKTIGDKKKFAIEINYIRELDGAHRCHLRVWINGLPVGSDQDETYLGYLVDGLHPLINNPKRFEVDYNLLNREDESIFQIVHNSQLGIGQRSYSKYLIDWGDSFDDFFIFSIFSNDNFRFYWMLFRDPYFNYRDIEVEKIYSGEVEFEYLSNIRDTIVDYQNELNRGNRPNGSPAVYPGG